MDALILPFVLTLMLFSAFVPPPVQSFEGYEEFYLTSDFRDRMEQCPKRDLIGAKATNKICVKQCRSDKDCISKRKKCLCDDICGLSCVKPSFCGMPPKQPQTRHNAPAEKLEFELATLVQYTCWPGYKTSGFSQAKCIYHNKTAQWFGPDMQCIPINCPDPGDLVNGERNLTSLTFASKVTYKCKPGYVMEGRADRYCQATKQWSGTLPVCIAVECPVPFDPPNGRAIFSSTKYTSMVTYECRYGFKLVGDKTRVCETNKSWSGVEPYCATIDCDSPGKLYNGNYDIQSTLLGAVVKFRCNIGSVFSGFEQSVCQENETWSNPLPECLSPCKIPSVENGYINRTFYESEFISHGDNVTIICDELYEFPSFDRDYIECQNGSWSQKATCVPARCKTLPKKPKNGIVIAPKSDHNMKARFICKDGFRLVGENTTRCQYGNWTENTPNCTIVYCSYPGDLQNGTVLIVGNLGFYPYRQYVKKISNDKQIKYECHKSFTISSGPLGATCIRGRWSPSEMPTCVPDKHPTLRWVRSITEIYRTRRAVIRKLNAMKNRDSTCRKNLREISITRRKCSRSCHQDHDCVSHHRHCLCDGSCGLSCIKPGHCTHPGTPPKGAVYLAERSNFTLFDADIISVEDGRQIHFACAKNYRLIGSPYSVCDGHEWNPAKLPKCVPMKLVPKKYKNPVTAMLFTLSSAAPKSLEVSDQISNCPNLKSIMGLEVLDYSKGNSSYNDGNVTVKCREGYELNISVKTLRCIDGKWHPSKPTCQIVRCKAIKESNGVIISTNETKYDTEVIFQCKGSKPNQKYTLEGTNKAVCLSSGKWSNKEPICIQDKGDFGISSDETRSKRSTSRRNSRRRRHRHTRSKEPNDRRMHRRLRKGNRNNRKNTPCPNIVNSPKMKIFPSNTNQTINFTTGKLTIVCGGGYALNLKNPIVNCVRGRWRPRLPVCDPLKCTVPQSDNGNYKMDQDVLEESQMIEHGLNIEFICKEGYVRHGVDNIRCWYGQWSTEELPQCTPAACLLPNISNGNYVDGYRGGLAIAHGSFLTYTCQEGYLYEKSETLVCHMGRILPKSPKCTPIDQVTHSSIAPCKVPEIQNGKFHTKNQEIMVSQSISHDQTITLTCIEGFVVNGEANLKCIFGEWATIQLPNCSPGPCTLPEIRNGHYVGNIEAGQASEHGSEVVYACDESFIPDTVDPLKCHQTRLLPISPQCTSHDGQVDIASSITDLANKMTGTKPQSTMQGNSTQIIGGSGSLGAFRRPCRAPYIIENTLLYKGGQLISGDPTEHIYRHGVQVKYSCIIGITRQRTTWTITCDDSNWIGKSRRCADDNIDFQNKTCEFRNSEPNLVAFHDDKMITENLTELDAGTQLVFRCKDIGKFSMIGSVQRRCIDGEWDGIKPSCFGLSQENDYALEKPPTILFRHQLGPIAQTNDGKLLVYPGTIVHMECLWLRKFGIPEWVVSHKHRNYPVGWASEKGRDENLEYRLSIYHAQEGDSGRFTCVTPMGHKHSIEVNVSAIHCPELMETEVLMISTLNNKFNSEVMFNCKNRRRSNNEHQLTLQGSDKLTCLPSGKWSDGVPTCKAPKCPVWNNVTRDNLSMRTDITMQGMKLMFTCQPGYILNGSSEIWCTKSKNWPTPFPTCVRPLCPRMSNITSGDLIMTTVSNDKGLMLKFKCKPGFVLRGNDEHVCGVSGEWSQPHPTCLDVGCNRPREPTDGFIQDTRASLYKVGDIVMFACNQGYMMTGKGLIACQENGQWSGSVPSCVQACAYPGVTEGGTISDAKFYYRVGEDVSFDCDPELRLEGPRMLKCLKSGLWSSAIPRCVST